MPRGLILFILWVQLCLTSCGVDLPETVAVEYEALPKEVDFNFHVRPILSDRCYSCHGPDEQARQAELRLDQEASAFAALTSGNGYAIVSGNPNRSELVSRILSEDPELVMPTPESKLSLSDLEKAILIKWIEQGAEWKAHWAFIPPKKEQPPVVPGVDQPIDLFVGRQLVNNGLGFSPEANKERLLRRVTLDLTGLPPTIKEIDAFLADTSPDAYEKVVDNLLKSPACAERLAMEWMDVARYADSHGMHADGYRFMWPWRDWVIRAFQENMPYDQFITWQIAGDLLPNATKEQRLATAFHRNHPMTAEGGVVDEEFRLNYVFDRAETTATAMMGLTLNCARCHDHKFDPISQQEYFQMTAFFNNIKELGMTGDDGNYGPMLLMTDDATDAKLAKYRDEVRELEAALKHKADELVRKKNFIQTLPKKIRAEGRIAHYPFDKMEKNKAGQFIVDGNPNSEGNNLHLTTAGPVGQAIVFAGDYDEIRLKDVGDFEMTEAFSVGLWARVSPPQKGKTQTLIGNAGHKNNYWRGWDFYLDSLNYLQARLIHSLPHNYLHVKSMAPIPFDEWQHLAFTYDGSGKAAGLRLLVNGVAIDVEVPYDRLYKSTYPIAFATHVPQKHPLLVGKSYRAFTGENGIFQGAIDDIQLFNRALSAIEILSLVDKLQLEEVTNEQRAEYWLSNADELVPQQQKLTEKRNALLAAISSIPEIMVLEEMPEARTTYAYNRGEYDAPMYEVTAGTPEVLPSFSEKNPPNRLSLAKWLFEPEHPLTARVAVNRYWQMLFGEGIVRTPQDFGVQGELPSHPALLDWLAVDLIEHNWDLKHLLRTIVLSATYRQSSKASEELREIDPGNKLLARGPSYRLPAEMIRDNALAASGLLVDQIGGESVRPYQPEGLWIEKGNFSHVLLRYKETKGDSLYRRSMYTFVKRTSPHPAMTAFDAPNRDVCTLKRENTNTPLQSLILLNDPQFVEAAKILAARAQLEGGDSSNAQINYAFRLLTGRHLKKDELAIFQQLFEDQLVNFKADPSAAMALLAVGEMPVDEQLDVPHTAALSVVTSTMINHDEAYMKR